MINAHVARDIVASEVCNGCEFKDTPTADRRYCARTTESIAIDVGTLIMSKPDFRNAPDDEPCHVEIGGGVSITTDKKSFAKAHGDAVIKLGNESRKCSVAYSRYRLELLAGRLATEFTPLNLYSKAEVMEEILPH